jgi:hypothetical protein
MARDKITEKLENLGGDLPKLTARERRYVQARAEGMNQSDAYRAAVDTSNMKPETIWAQASRMESSHKVRAWVSAVMAQAVERGGYTLAAHVEELDAFIREAKAAGNYGAAGNALQAKGKAVGLYIDRTMDMRKPEDTGSVLDAIEQLLGPQARKAAAIELGISEKEKGPQAH